MRMVVVLNRPPATRQITNHWVTVNVVIASQVVKRSGVGEVESVVVPQKTGEVLRKNSGIETEISEYAP
jgi:hypothetical protein